MFKYKNISLKLLSLTLFTTVGFHNINEASARIAKTASYDSVSPDADEIYIVEGKSINDNVNLPLASGNTGEDSAFDLDGFEGFSNSAGSSKIKTVRTVSFYLFLLLFVPFGIFYPFFLFYKKLLNTDRQQDSLTEDSTNSTDNTESKLPIKSFSAESLKLEKSTNDIQAVVSKLQIAFAVQDDSLRQKLEELCSSVDSRTDQGIAELMRKTISLLINEDESTHACYSSESLPIDRIKTEFEAICTKEQSKFVTKKLSAVGGDGQEPTSQTSSNVGSARYMVVTLVLCTSHVEPLFTDINTRNQLLEELSELGKMRQDDLIKFDLLWNPQSKGQYLSNNELLMKYIDMMRLF